MLHCVFFLSSLSFSDLFFKAKCKFIEARIKSIFTDFFTSSVVIKHPSYRIKERKSIISHKYTKNENENTF